MRNKEKKPSKAKEQLVAFGRDVAENYTETVNNEKKSKVILIVAGVVLCALVVGWWFIGNSEEKIDGYTPGSQFEGAIEDDVDDEEDIDVTAYTLHDERLVGMWGPEGFDTEKFAGASYDAYIFREDGSVTQSIGENGETFIEYGEWKTDKDGNVYISWKQDNGEEFFSEVIPYSFSEGDGALIFNDNDYYPMNEKDSVVFS